MWIKYCPIEDSNFSCYAHGAVWYATTTPTETLKRGWSKRQSDKKVSWDLSDKQLFFYTCPVIIDNRKWLDFIKFKRASALVSEFFRLVGVEIVVNSIKIVLLVRAHDQRAMFVLLPGPSFIRSSTHSFDIFLLLTFLF